MRPFLFLYSNLLFCFTRLVFFNLLIPACGHSFLFIHGGGVGGGAVDVQRDLLEKCEQLPELQRRLQTATAKLGTILSQMDASAAAVEA